MMRVRPQELMEGARIKLTPNGPVRTVASNEPYPEDPRFRHIEDTHGGFFAPTTGRLITLVGGVS